MTSMSSGILRSAMLRFNGSVSTWIYILAHFAPSPPKGARGQKSLSRYLQPAAYTGQFSQYDIVQVAVRHDDLMAESIKWGIGIRRHTPPGASDQ